MQLLQCVTAGQRLSRIVREISGDQWWTPATDGVLGFLPGAGARSAVPFMMRNEKARALVARLR